MFTGLISGIGVIVAASDGRYAIAGPYPAQSIASGASICCDGVCLTATSVVAEGEGASFTVDVSNETRAKSTLSDWHVGQRVNLERSLRAGDELGGHIVSGHVDGIARIVSITDDGDSRRFTLDLPEHLSRYVAPKGSIALDGTSLTVNEVSGNRFGVNLIPHSLTMTTWGAKTRHQNVNVEIDVFARYVARLLEFRP